MSLAVLSEQYLRHLETLNYSPLTIKNQRSHLRRFLSYADKAQVVHAHQLRREHLEDYIDELTWAPTRRGVPMSVCTRNVRLVTVRSFVRWLYERDHIGYDLATLVHYAREPQPLPRNVLTEQQVQRLLAEPDTKTLLGYRDHVMLSVLYATGIRVGELCGLDVCDVDVEAAYVHVRHGKGDKDRVVPLGQRTSKLVTSYLHAVRCELAKSEQQALIVNYKGGRLSTGAVCRLVAEYGRRAGLETHVTPHILRHACATHMMRRGAPLRHVQDLLGHASADSTEIYTRLTALELIAAHAKYHPREIDPAP